MRLSESLVASLDGYYSKKVQSHNIQYALRHVQKPFCEYTPEVAYRQIRQNITPVFGNKDQVDVQYVNDMSASSIFHLVFTWTDRYINSMKRRGYQYKLHPSDEQATLFV